jgi:hypothetical protein
LLRKNPTIISVYQGKNERCVGWGEFIHYFLFKIYSWKITIWDNYLS